MQNKSQNVFIAIAIYEHVLATSITLPVEMLKAGEAFARRQSKLAPSLTIELVAETPVPIKSRSGIALLPDKMAINAGTPDFIITPSLWRNPRPLLRKHPNTISWLENCWNDGSTIIGTGTGVCFLAESGLLNHHSATTHWHYVEQFKRDYPKVDLKPEFFITQSERIYCAASLNALADIVVHLLEQLYGLETAQHVERNFSHEIRKPYEEQRYLEGAVDRHADELIAQIQFWMKTNMSSPMTLSEIANLFGVSQRSLTRRFKAATGETANSWWLKEKLENAKDLLASTNLSIQEIGFEVGFQDQGHFTRVFKKELSQTPRTYRNLVRKKLFSQEA